MKLCASQIWLQLSRNEESISCLWKGLSFTYQCSNMLHRPTVFSIQVLLFKPIEAAVPIRMHTLIGTIYDICMGRSPIPTWCFVYQHTVFSVHV